MALFGLEALAYGAGICARAIAEAHPELGIVFKEPTMKVTIELTRQELRNLRKQVDVNEKGSINTRLRVGNTVLRKVIDQVRSADVCKVNLPRPSRVHLEEGTSKQFPGA